jgi:preprotein translocase subunit SecB
MADENQTQDPGAAAGNQQSNEAQMAVEHVFLKDTSFEALSPQELEGSSAQPDINLNLAQRFNQINETRWEIILTVTVTAKQNDKTAFLCEVQYSGIFSFSGFTEQQMPYVINVLCPNVLFPYCRTQVAALVSAGGFYMPPMQAINFEAIFRQRMAEAQAKAEAGQGEAPTDGVQ